MIKKAIGMMLAVTVGLTATACSQANGAELMPAEERQETQETELPEDTERDISDQSNVLVVYFSCTGTTKRLAEYAAEALGAELYEITPEEPYTEADLAYYTGGRADREQDDPAARPAISGAVENMEQYHTVLLGYPIWHGQAPRIISTFLESYDFSGKRMIPFCTSGSSGIGSSASNLEKLCPESTNWDSGRRFGSGTSREEIVDWILGLHIAGDNGSDEKPETGTALYEDTQIMEYEEREILCERDGMTIYGMAYIPKGKQEVYPTVIIGHGFSGTYRDNLRYAKYLAERGIASYSFDFCGGSSSSRSGGTTTEMSVITETEDMKAVVDTLRQQDFVDTANLFLMGESQGGFVTAMTAAEKSDDVAGIILLYPAFVIQDNGKNSYQTVEQIPEQGNLFGVPIGRRYYADVWNLDIYEEIAAFEKPVLIFHGTADGLVPLFYSERAKDSYKDAELVVIENGGHGFYGEQADQVSRQICYFINQVAGYE